MVAQKAQKVNTIMLTHGAYSYAQLCKIKL